MLSMAWDDFFLAPPCFSLQNSVSSNCTGPLWVLWASEAFSYLSECVLFIGYVEIPTLHMSGNTKFLESLFLIVLFKVYPPKLPSISFIFLPNIYQIFFFVYHSIRQSKLHKDKSYSLFYHHITKTQTLARINQHHCFLFILLERLSAPLSVLLLPPHSFPVTRLTFIKSTRAHYRFVVSKLFMFP